MPQHARRRLTRRDVFRRTAVGGLALAGGAAIAGPLVAGADVAASTFGDRDDGNAYVVGTGADLVFKVDHRNGDLTSLVYDDVRVGVDVVAEGPDAVVAASAPAVDHGADLGLAVAPPVVLNVEHRVDPDGPHMRAPVDPALIAARDRDGDLAAQRVGLGPGTRSS